MARFTRRERARVSRGTAGGGAGDEEGHRSSRHGGSARHDARSRPDGGSRSPGCSRPFRGAGRGRRFRRGGARRERGAGQASVARGRPRVQGRSIRCRDEGRPGNLSVGLRRREDRRAARPPGHAPRPRRPVARMPRCTRTGSGRDRAWRSGWDSNPRKLAPQRFSRPPPSATRPPLRGENSSAPPRPKTGQPSRARRALCRPALADGHFMDLRDVTKDDLTEPTAAGLGGA